MGILSSIGNALNKVTGTNSSARQQYERQMALQKDAQAFSQWQMGNAHQMEVQDLQNAGLNPVLSAGGSGASAGVTEGSASAGVGSNIDPINTILNAMTTAKQIDMTNKEMDKIDAEIDNINAETELTKVTKKNASTKTTQAENDENFAKTWWGRNISPALRDIFGGGGGAVAAGATAGLAASKASSARKAAKRPITNVHYH